MAQMDMMSDVISPVLVFVVTAGIAGIGAEVMSIARTAKATQEAVKALMHSDLVDRYRTSCLENSKTETPYKTLLSTAFTTWSSNQVTPFIEIFTSLLSTS